jgi:hypothetical protein
MYDLRGGLASRTGVAPVSIFMNLTRKRISLHGGGNASSRSTSFLLGSFSKLAKHDCHAAHPNQCPTCCRSFFVPSSAYADGIDLPILAGVSIGVAVPLLAFNLLVEGLILSRFISVSFRKLWRPMLSANVHPT